ncbi:hypothetical protein Btru_008757 [Bulinus truncatus]|nr:hypothetical protein Btru_008757 [Bulinus truncatus]
MLMYFGKAYNTDETILQSILKQSSQPVLECGSLCMCNYQLCNNRVIQRGIKKKLKVFKTKNKGYGLQSLESILPLHFVCEYAGEVINEEEAKHRISETDKSGRDNYLIVLKEFWKGNELRTFVDPLIVGNIGRFINHSCDPNLIMVPVRINHSVPRLALFANQNIIAGEELTFDYSGGSTLSFYFQSGNMCPSSFSDTEGSNSNETNHPQLVNRKSCYCGSLLCKGFIPYNSCVV